MKRILIILSILSVLSLFLIAGCVNKPEPIGGGGKDEHGCITDALYTWCEAKQKCLRTWEEECPDVDYCESDDECVPLPVCHPMNCINKEFEDNYEKPRICPEIYMIGAAYSPEDCVCQENKCVNKNKLKSKAREFCDDENVDAVYVCGDNIKVVSSLPGAGSTYYKSDRTSFQCPVVAPDAMSEECRQLEFETECEEVCEGQIIGGQRDEHGCLGPAGYSWNASIGACVREWELDENQRRAAQIAVAPLSFGVTIVEVEVAACPGCFVVKMQRNDNQENLEITLEDWEVKEQPIRNYCTEEQRGAEVCVTVYAPVCGWFNKDVQCVKYPCAQTYSNFCFACLDDKVEYWTQGECAE